MILKTGVAKAGSSITFAAAKNAARCLNLLKHVAEQMSYDVKTRRYVAQT
jgi:hypothetical protein